MSSNRASLAQRSRQKLFFDNPDQDYYLSWILGRQVYQGSDPAECFEVAPRIVNGDAASWQREWRSLAEQVEADAIAARERGDEIRARSGFLRACTYYRAPLFLMRRQSPDFLPTWQKMQACFRQAAGLFDPPIEPIAVPFQGRQLPGYLWTVDSSRQPRPTLIVFGGIETFAEDCYFMVGPTGPLRGYNVLTVDLPGQGMNPDQGLVFGARMEIPVAVVIDYALGRPEVDAERLAIFGFSWGGHIVFKAARDDRRVRAMIANPPMPNVFRSVLAQQKGRNPSDPIARIAFDQIVWRMGLRISLNPRDIGRRFAKAYDYLMHGRVNVRRIPCPALLLAGEGEPPITLRIARETAERLPNRQSRVRIFTRDEGGEAHCQVNNLDLPNGAIFDWLDTVFGSRAEPGRLGL